MSVPHTGAMDQRERLIRQALERRARRTDYFASYARCSLGEAVVVLQRLANAGTALRGEQSGHMVWRAA